MKQSQHAGSNKHTKQRSFNLNEVFLAIFLMLTLLLGFTLLLYYQVNSKFEEEISLLRDIHHLRASLTPLPWRNVKLKGYIEMFEVLEGTYVLGKIEGLSPGTTHAIHVLQFSDILTKDEKKLSKEVLRHFNPGNVHHSCPSNDVDDNYHTGDLGNVIANNEGIAFLAIVRKISIRSLSGRVLVITNSEDKCENALEYDKPEDIVGYGLLNVYRQDMPTTINYSQDFFVKQINSFKKQNFEKANQIFKNIEVKNREEQHNSRKSQSNDITFDNNYSKPISEPKIPHDLQSISTKKQKIKTNHINHLQHPYQRRFTSSSFPGKIDYSTSHFLQQEKKITPVDSTNNDLEYFHLNPRESKLRKKISVEPISLFQIPSSDKEFSKNSLPLQETSFVDNPQPHSPADSHPTDFSIESPNIEPIVNRLEQNTTALNLIKDIDEDLINPFVGLEIHSNLKGNNTKDLIHGNEETKNDSTKSSEISFSILNSIDTINAIVKNRTIMELQNMKESPIDLPLHNSSASEIILDEVMNSKMVKKPLQGFLSKFSDANLIKFREKGSLIVMDNDLHKSPSQQISQNHYNSTIYPTRETFQSQLISESAHKLLENLEKNETKLLKELKEGDNGKLFLDNIKKSILRIDEIASRFIQK